MLIEKCFLFYRILVTLVDQLFPCFVTLLNSTVAK